MWIWAQCCCSQKMPFDFSKSCSKQFVISGPHENSPHCHMLNHPAPKQKGSVSFFKLLHGWIVVQVYSFTQVNLPVLLQLYLLNVWVKHEIRVKKLVKKKGLLSKSLMSEAIPGVENEENRIKLFNQQCLFTESWNGNSLHNRNLLRSRSPSGTISYFLALPQKTLVCSIKQKKLHGS